MARGEPVRISYQASGGPTVLYDNLPYNMIDNGSLSAFYRRIERDDSHEPALRNLNVVNRDGSISVTSIRGMYVKPTFSYRRISCSDSDSDSDFKAGYTNSLGDVTKTHNKKKEKKKGKKKGKKKEKKKPTQLCKDNHISQILITTCCDPFARLNDIRPRVWDTLYSPTCRRFADRGTWGLVSELRPGEGRKQKEQHQEDTNPNQADMGKVPNGAWDEWQLLFKTSNILASILLNDSARTERNSGIKPLKSGRRSLASNMHCSQIASLALPI
ncbi:hypothetical protein FRB91_004271 [Serendipita sp. 411]|nr:hypothetical protein FRB91_004271 [Serendipita sp. 411]